jgi:hypothetical protein
MICRGCDRIVRQPRRHRIATFAVSADGSIADTGRRSVEPSDLGLLALKLSASHLTPTALEFANHPLRLVSGESIEASVAQQPRPQRN